MRKCSPSLAIKEMQIRSHLTPVRMATIKDTNKTTSVGKDAGRKGTLIHCWWECELVQPLWKTVWRLLKN
jgi:hypothetical protein